MCAMCVLCELETLTSPPNSLSTLGRFFFFRVCSAILPLSPQVDFTCPTKAAVTACCRASSYLILVDLAVCIHKCAEKPDLSSLLLNFAAHIWFVTLCASSSPGTCSVCLRCLQPFFGSSLIWSLSSCIQLPSLDPSASPCSAQAQAWMLRWVLLRDLSRAFH